MAYGRRRRFATSNRKREGRFPNPNMRGRFSNSIHDKGEGYSNLDEFRIPSFDGNLDIESSLMWIDDFDKLFDIAYILMENHVKFVTYKLKKRILAQWNRLQNIHMQQGKSPISTWRWMKRLLQGKFLPPNYHQILFKQFERTPKEIEPLPDILKSSFGFPLTMN